MSSQKKLSLPIASAPINALFLGIFIGFTLICLVVDGGSTTLNNEFYGTKNSTPPLWFTGFNLFMLVSGLYTNTANFVYIFTRHSSRTRKMADGVQMALFVGLVAFSVIVVQPSEKIGNAFSNHLVVLFIQVAQLVTAFVAFKNQGGAVTNNNNKGTKKD